MAVREQDVELIVRQILSEMGTKTATPAPAVSAPKATGSAIPTTARVAMLTELGKFELQEHKIPALGDDDILVKVEGCGVCGTDAHEFKNDPFGLIPVVLGHEGTGEIVKMLKKTLQEKT